MSIKLPNQEFLTTTGTINLAHEASEWLVLYFYPKDSTSGCTTQATAFSALKNEFSMLGAQIVGVSRDSVKTHQNFTQKQALTIELISDKDEMLCRYFDVIKEKNMYGKKAMGIERSTFIFHKGQLVKEFRKVKAAGHAEIILNEIKNLVS